MNKKLFSLFILTLLVSCKSISDIEKDKRHTLKSQSASQRINSIEENSKNVLKDLDE